MRELSLFEVVALFAVGSFVCAFILSASIFYFEGYSFDNYNVISKTIVIKEINNSVSHYGFIDNNGDGYYFISMPIGYSNIIPNHTYKIGYFCSFIDGSRKVFKIKDITVPVVVIPTVPTPTPIPDNFVCKTINGVCE